MPRWWTIKATDAVMDELDAMPANDAYTLANDPLAGDLVPGLGGVRKVRFAPKGRGKSGAFRVIYYVLTDELPVLALLIYGKNEQVNPTPDQTRAIMAVVAEFKAGPRTRTTCRRLQSSALVLANGAVSCSNWLTMDGAACSHYLPTCSPSSPAGSQQLPIHLRCILRSAIGMMDAAARRRSVPDCRPQCRDSDAGIHRSADRVADHLA